VSRSLNATVPPRAPQGLLKKAVLGSYGGPRSGNECGPAFAHRQMMSIVSKGLMRRRRGIKLRCKIACSWFFNRVRCRTRCAAR
jgi:hypothetical protein